MLEIKNLTKIYQSKNAEPVVALDNISLSFNEKGMVFLLGKSGSGKSTLLNVLGGLDKFDGGEIIIDGKSSKEFKESDFDSYRNTYLGFIFQEYNILSEFTVYKNIEFALELQGKKANKEEVENLLEQVDLKGYGKRKPNELSGGQKQRIAIARALIKNPQIIMADEPTGALDSNTGKQVLDTLKKLSEEKLVIVVSHDREFAEYYGDRIIELKDGKVISDTTKRERAPQQLGTGFNIIDDNVIHIQKGHKFTPEEASKINNFLSKAEGDIILTSDEKLNTEVKKLAKISESGNREYFDNTNENDLQKQQDGKELKLIKSRLKFKDSLKMGASGLKTKKFRLFMTILLSAIALTLFGIADTMASFNVKKSNYNSLIKMNTTTLSINLRHINRWGSGQEENIGDAELATLRQNFPEYEFKGIYAVDGNTISGSQIYYNSISNYYYYRTDVSGVTSLTADEMAKANLEFLTDSSGATSRLPQNDDEIVLTEYHYQIMQEYGLRVSTPDGGGWFTDEEVKVTKLSDVIGKTIKLNSFDNKLYKIVGILKVNLDLTEFEELKEVNPYKMTSQQYDLSRRLSQKIDEGFNNLVILTEEEIATLCSENTVEYTDLYYGFSDEYIGRSTSKLGYLSDDSEGEFFYFDGRNGGKELLKENEVLIDPSTYLYYGDFENDGYNFYLQKNDYGYFFDGNPYETKSEVTTAIRNKFNENFGSYGTSLPVCFLTSDDEKDTSKDYKIVGLYFDEASYDNQDIILFKNKTVIPAEARVSFNPYKNIIVNLIENQARNRELILSLSEYDSKSDVMVIRSEISGTLEDFCDLIKTLAKIFIYVGIGFAVFAALLLMNFIAISISYKKKEIGILRALGARGSDVYGIFLNESMIITLINFIVSLIFTIVAVVVINHIVLTEFNFKITLLNFGIRQILLLLAVSIVVALVATFLPTHKISKMKPIDAILDRKTK